MDAAETALAHLIPEFTAGWSVLILIAMLRLSVAADLPSLLTIPIVVLAMFGWLSIAKRTIKLWSKTKKLRDTALEPCGITGLSEF